jgi:ATP-dependent Clp protease adaptor protein ClpS
MNKPSEQILHGTVLTDGSRCFPLLPVARLTPDSLTRPSAKPVPDPGTQVQSADSWRVVLLNDPVNRMSYVVMVLRRVLGFDEPLARHHMLAVHEQGRSVVWTGNREQAEAYMFALHQWHLMAIIQPDEAS